MQLKPFVFFISFLFFSVSLYGAEITTRLSKDENRSFLGFGAENSTFTLATGDIKGMGGRVDFTHFLAPKINFQMHLASGFNTTNSFALSLTSLGAYGFYSVMGSCCESGQFLSVNGQPILSEKTQSQPSLNVGIGIEQYTLYGTTTSYPASGLGAAINYQFYMWSYRWKAEVKTSSLSIGSTKVTGTAFNFGLMFDI